MKVDVVTIFPEYLAPLELSLIGKASATGLVELAVHDLREWTYDVHRTVDDTPYGGGPGMVMRPEPWGAALDALCPGPAASGPRSGATRDDCSGAPGEARGPEWSLVAPEATGPRERSERQELGSGHLIVPSPAGVPFTQARAHELAAESHLIFACGRYEGIDQRVLDHAAARMPVTEISLGDYVLFGGEVAVLVILEAVVRLLPGVLGNADSLIDESHVDGLLEAPVYTKPSTWRELPVPAILRSGDHGRIARWRRDQALLRTAARRPDLLAALPPDALDKHDRAVLAEGGFQISAPDMAK